MSLLASVVINIFVWIQMNGQFIKGAPAWLSSKALILAMGAPLGLSFWYATKWGYIGFGNLWAVRFMGFATSMLTFPIMTYFYLGEPMSLKTLLTLGLAIIIMIIQLF